MAEVRYRIESGLDTRWEEDLTGGPHLSMTLGHGTRLSMERREGRVLVREGKLGRGSQRTLGRGKDRGRVESGPLDQNERGEFFSLFLFSVSLFFKKNKTHFKTFSKPNLNSF